MSLNNILIRPQILDQDLTPQEYRLVNILIELSNRLVRDVMDGGTAAEKLTQAFQETAVETMQELEARALAAGAKIQAFFQPILDAFQDLMGEDFANTTADVFKMVSGVVGLVEDLTEALMTETLSVKLKELVSIMENDLGLTQTKIRTLLSGLADKMIAALTSDYLGGNQDEEATRHFVIGTYLEQLKDAILEGVNVPDFQFNLNDLVDKLIIHLRKLDWDEILEKIKGVVEKANSATEGLGKFMGGFSGKFTVSANTEGEASILPDPPSWYASWFFNDWGSDQVRGVRDRFDLSGEGFASQINFKEGLELPFMEHFAMSTSVIQDFGEALLHGLSAEKGDISNNVINAIMQAFKGSLSIGLHDTDDSSWVDAYKVIANWWIEYGTSFVLNFATAFESGHSKGHSLWTKFVFYATLFGKDFVETLMYNSWIGLLRNLMLSIFTLINHDKDNAPNALNKNKIEGMAFAWAELGVWLSGFIGGRKWFGLPVAKDSQGAGFFILQWALGIVCGYASSLAGWGISHALAGERASDETFGHVSWKTSLLCLLKWPIYWYYIWNGDTDNGTWGKDRSDPPQVVTFPGYQDHETSPYLMPFLKDMCLQGAQGNNGVWSHNWGTGQIYAVDFAHDHWDEVLASRSGVVWDYFDLIRDHDTFTDNNLTIRHTHPSEPQIPNPVHDRDHTGEVVTDAQYVHGAHYGIRYAFGSRGIPAEYIIGTPVRQGMHVMFSGDTGMSAYNHLHFMIQSEKARSIPFVFKDMPDEKGVLKDLQWYVSSNEKKDPFKPIAIIHLPDHQSHELDDRFWARYTAPTANVIELYAWDNTIKRWYDLAANDHAFDSFYIVHHNSGQRRIIQKHEFEVRTVPGPPPVDEFPTTITVGTAWNPIPSLFDNFSIFSLSRGGGDNHIILDKRAADFDNVYNGQLIVVRWVDDTTGNTICQHRKIIDYHGGDRKATVANNWDMNPPAGAEFAIGAPTYEDTAEKTVPKTFRHRFAHIAPYNFDADRSLYQLARSQPMPGGADSKKLTRGAYFHGAAHQGRLGANTAAGANTVTLNPAASNVVDFYKDQYIKLYLGVGANRIGVYHRKITGYSAARVATLDRPLGKVTLSSGTDSFVIGGKKKANASAETVRKNAFWGKDNPVNSPNPVNFDDNTVPYTYITFKGGKERRT